MLQQRTDRFGRVLAAVVACALLGATGCSAKKKAASPEPGTTQAGLAGEALQTLEAVRYAYIDQDMERVLSLFDRRYYPDVSRLRRALYEDREKITQVRLDFNVDQDLAGDAGASLITVRWNRGWTDIATGVPQLASGRVEFQFGEGGNIIDMRPVNGGLPIGFN